MIVGNQKEMVNLAERELTSASSGALWRGSHDPDHNRRGNQRSGGRGV